MAIEKSVGRLSHREYVIDRTTRMNRLFSKLQADPQYRSDFYNDPCAVCVTYEITLSDEEVFLIRSLRHVDLENLKERLVLGPVANYDANCQCGAAPIDPIGGVT